MSACTKRTSRMPAWCDNGRLAGAVSRRSTPGAPSVPVQDPALSIQDLESGMGAEHRVNLERRRQIGIGHLRIGGQVEHHGASVPLAAIGAQKVPGGHVADALRPVRDRSVDIGGSEIADDPPALLQHPPAIGSVRRPPGVIEEQRSSARAGSSRSYACAADRRPRCGRRARAGRTVALMRARRTPRRPRPSAGRARSRKALHQTPRGTSQPGSS